MTNTKLKTAEGDAFYHQRAALRGELGGPRFGLASIPAAKVADLELFGYRVSFTLSSALFDAIPADSRRLSLYAPSAIDAAVWASRAAQLSMNDIEQTAPEYAQRRNVHLTNRHGDQCLVGVIRSGMVEDRAAADAIYQQRPYLLARQTYALAFFTWRIMPVSGTGPLVQAHAALSSFSTADGLETMANGCPRLPKINDADRSYMAWNALRVIAGVQKDEA